MTHKVIESHALIKCPHCGNDIRVKARTLKGKTVEQAMRESKWTDVFVLPKWFRDLLRMLEL